MRRLFTGRAEELATLDADASALFPRLGPHLAGEIDVAAAPSPGCRRRRSGPSSTGSSRPTSWPDQYCVPALVRLYTKELAG